MADLDAPGPSAPGLGSWVDDDQVAAVLGRPPDQAQLLTHNPMNAVTGGIWRVTAGDATAVCKVVTDGSGADAPAHWEASTDPHHFNYWRREIEWYGNDGAARYRPEGVDAPRLLHLDDRGSVGVLWTESLNSLTRVSGAALLSEFHESDTGLAIGAGFGVDVPLTSALSLRPEFRTYSSVAMSRMNLGLHRGAIGVRYRW